MPSVQYSRIVHRRGPRPILAVGARRTLDGSHAAIAYYSKSPVRGLRLLHLAFHRDLRDHSDTGRSDHYAWITLGLEQAEEIALAGYCRLVARNEQRNNIPYNLQYDEGTRFDRDTGELVLPDGATGMSCATFVVHLFRSAGIHLVDVTGYWRLDRPGDQERQQQLVNALANHPDPECRAQAALITSEIGCARVRPEDVAGACLFCNSERPANYADCELGGRIIAAILE